MGLDILPESDGVALTVALTSPIVSSFTDTWKLRKLLKTEAPRLNPFLWIWPSDTIFTLGSTRNSEEADKINFSTLQFNQKIRFYPRHPMSLSGCCPIYTLWFPNLKLKALLFIRRLPSSTNYYVVKYPDYQTPVSFTREEREKLSQFFDILTSKDEYGRRSDDLDNFIAFNGLRFQYPIQSPGVFMTDMETDEPHPSFQNEEGWLTVRWLSPNEAALLFGNDPTKPKIPPTVAQEEAYERVMREVKAAMKNGFS